MRYYRSETLAPADLYEVSPSSLPYESRLEQTWGKLPSNGITTKKRSSRMPHYTVCSLLDRGHKNCHSDRP
jgi:hypothetical protein